jgi:hypothetical protein
MVHEAAENAAQGTAQGLSNNAIAKAIYDENRELLEGLAGEAGLGAGTGAIMSLLVSAVAGVRAKARGGSAGAGGEIPGRMLGDPPSELAAIGAKVDAAAPKSGKGEIESPVEEQLRERLESREGKPFDSTLDDLYRKAAKEKPQFDAVAEEIAKATGSKLKTAPLKGRKRASAKIESDYNGDATRIRDLLRVTISNENPQQVVDFVRRHFGVEPKRNTLGNSPPRTRWPSISISIESL